jgi:YVTN family beta-propeller protein
MAMASTPNALFASDSNVLPSVLPDAINVGSGPQSIAVTPDGLKVYVVNVSSGTVSVIDATTGQVSKTVPVGSGPTSIAMHKDGEFAYVTNNSSNNVSKINTIDDTSTIVLTNDDGILAPRGVIFSPDGSRAFVSNQASTGKIIEINPLDNSVVGEISVQPNPRSLAISPNGQTLFATHTGGNLVSFVDLTTNPPTAQTLSTGTGSNPAGLAVNSTGTELYVALRGSGNLIEVDTSNRQITATITGFFSPDGVTLNPEGTHLFVANSGNGTIRMVDLATNEKVDPALGVSSGAIDVRFVPNGLTAYVTNSTAGTVSVLSYYQPRTLSFATTSYTLAYGATQTLTATTSAGSGVGAISYSHGNSTACTVDSTSGVVTMTNSTGTCSISSTITRGGATRATAFAQASTSTPVTITPAQAPITVAATSQSVSVGSSVSAAFSISSGALVSTDNISGVTFTFEGTGSTNYPASTTPPTEVGTYSVTPSSAVFGVGSLSNYNIIYASGTLTIQAASSPPLSSGVSGGASPLTVQLVSPRGLEVLRSNGGFVTLPKPSETRKKFLFSGWSEFRDGRGQIYKAGELLEVIRNKTLYATWSPKPSRTVASQFGPNSAVLSKATKVDVKRFLRAVPNVATVTCVGSVSSSRITPQLRVLGQARAKATCGYISELRPKLNVKIANNVVFSLGSNNRSAVLTSR